MPPRSGVQALPFLFPHPPLPFVPACLLFPGFFRSEDERDIFVGRCSGSFIILSPHLPPPLSTRRRGLLPEMKTWSGVESAAARVSQFFFFSPSVCPLASANAGIRLLYLRILIAPPVEPRRSPSPNARRIELATPVSRSRALRTSPKRVIHAIVRGDPSRLANETPASRRDL